MNETSGTLPSSDGSEVKSPSAVAPPVWPLMLNAASKFGMSGIAEPTEPPSMFPDS